MSDQLKKSAIRYFGDYILLGEIARGGMGVVYHAVQASLDREVAIKMIDAGTLAGEAAGRRFQTEAEAMAQLDHPHIVSIYEVGEHEGQRYLAMKLIEGNSLAEQIAEGRWNIDASNRKERQQAIARLMATVAGAVHHAHQRGVLHRDIKPGNILLDEESEPHVTDFGLAKLTENDVGLSQTGAVLGTPSYMAPEQAAGKTRQITTATDVYALGVVLYELLTGERPFHADDVIEVLKMVVQQEPRRPRSLNPMLDRDLETICLKCLEKNPKNRYHTAEDLSNDLERWGRCEPIYARSIGTLERGLKWARRRPALASSLGVIACFSILLGLLGFYASKQAVTVKQLEVDEIAARQITDRTLVDLELRKAQERFAADDAPNAVALLAAVLRQNPTNRLAARQLISVLTQRTFPIPGLRTEPVFAWPPSGRAGSIRFSATNFLSKSVLRFWDENQQPSMEHLLEVGYDVRAAELTDDGKFLLTVSSNSFDIWDLASPQKPQTSVKTQTHIEAAGFVQGTGRLFTILRSRTADGQLSDQLQQWDRKSGNPVSLPINLAFLVGNAQVNSRGDVAITSSGNESFLWNLNTGNRIGAPLHHDGFVFASDFSPDGLRLATAAGDNLARIWDAYSGQEIIPPIRHPDSVRFAKFSPDGLAILTASGEQAISRLWDSRTGKALTEPIQHREETERGVEFANPRFGSDSYDIFTGAGRWREDRWDARPAGALPLILSQNLATRRRSGYGREIKSAKFSPDGKLLVTTGSLFDGGAGAWIWDLGTGLPALTPLDSKGDPHLACFSADGRHLFTASDSRVTFWESRTGRALGEPLEHGWNVNFALLTRGGGRLVTLDQSRRFRVWDVQKSLVTFTLTNQFPDREEALRQMDLPTISPDGHLLLTRVDETDLQVWDLQTSRKLVDTDTINTLSKHFEKEATAEAITGTSGEKQRLEGEIRPDPPFNQRLDPPFNHSASVRYASFSGDSQRLITASDDGTARIWEARTGHPLAPPLQHNGGVNFAIFSPDGQKAVTTSQDKTARLWNTRTGKSLCEPLRHDFPVQAAVFSPDGDSLFTATDKDVRAWDVETGQPLSLPLTSGDDIKEIEISPDGRWLAVVSELGPVKLYEVPQASVPVPLWFPDLAEAIAGVRLDARGNSQPVSGTEYRQQTERLKEQLTRMDGSDPYTVWVSWFLERSLHQRNIT